MKSGALDVQIGALDVQIVKTKKNRAPKVVEVYGPIGKVEVGDRCLLFKGEIGVVAFVGKVENKPGEFVGLVLDTPVGKNDGSVNGNVYFQARLNHGMFVREKEIAKLLPKEEKVYLILPVPDEFGETSKTKPAYVFVTPQGEPKYLIREFLTMTKMFIFRNGLDEPPELLFCLRGQLICSGDSKSELIGKFEAHIQDLFPGSQDYALTRPIGGPCFLPDDFFEAKSTMSIQTTESKSKPLVLGYWKLNQKGPRVPLDQRQATEAHIFVDYQNELKDAFAHFLVLQNLSSVIDMVSGRDKVKRRNGQLLGAPSLVGAALLAHRVSQIAEIIDWNGSNEEK